MQPTLAAGDPAPDFTLNDKVWNTVKVKDHAETVHQTLCQLS
jgi:peroxiredoxin